eukprot:gene24480-44889_t
MRIAGWADWRPNRDPTPPRTEFDPAWLERRGAMEGSAGGGVEPEGERRDPPSQGTSAVRALAEKCEADVQQMCAMGIGDETQCRAALERCGWIKPNAICYMLDHPPPRAAAAPAAAAPAAYDVDDHSDDPLSIPGPGSQPGRTVAPPVSQPSPDARGAATGEQPSRDDLLRRIDTRD